MDVLLQQVINGLVLGSMYALVALGYTMVYGIINLINFAHGAALMMALYGVYFLRQALGIDPYLALPLMVPAMFVVGYLLQRVVIERASHGKDENILLVTLGISIVLENLALLFFKSDTRTIDTAYTLTTVEIGPAFIALPKLVSFAGALVVSAVLLLIVQKTDLGRAIRAVSKEKQGARLMGIDVDHVYAMCFGLGLASLGAAACFLMPAYYVNPQVGNGFVLVAFTIVVLGGMATVFGPLVGAITLLVSEEILKALTDHWMAVLGPLIVLVVLTARRGLYGYLLDIDVWRARRQTAAAKSQGEQP